jgi:hypothetical protein
MLRTSLLGFITRLLKLGIGVSVLVIEITHDLVEMGNALPVYVTVCTGLSISMWSVGPFDTVLINESGSVR